MKKVIVLLSSSLMLLSFNGCNFNSTHTSKICEYQYENDNTMNIMFDFFSKNPNIPYITLENYNTFFIDQMYHLTDYESIEKIDNKYIFTNKMTNSQMIFDPSDNTIFYDNFALYNSTSTTPHCEIESPDSIFPCKKIEEESSYIKGESRTVNLNSYNLLAPIVENGNVYLPLDLVFRLDTMLSDSSSYYNGKNKVVYYDANYKITIDNFNPYSKTYATYCYDLFTFDVDQIFGIIGYNRPLRSKNNENYTFIEGGARAKLEKYKDKIINSKTITDFDINFGEMFKEEFPDGGHSGINYVSFFTDTEKLPKNYSLSDEFLKTEELLENETKARNNASSEQSFKSAVCSFDTDKDGHKDVGFLTINSFSINPTDFKDSLIWVLGSPMGANYAFNKSANGSSEAKYIKDVVIDIANNGGGSTAAEGILLSWICNGKAKQVLKDGKDNSVTTSVFQYDINKDGTYDEKDYLPNDVNIYILTDATFSAASALAFDTYMYTLTDEYKTSNKNIKFIGKPNLGGCCSVASNITIPTGICYQLSSQSVGVNWNDYSKTCDEIMPITNGWEMDLSQIVNRTGYIIPKIVDQRQ